MADLLIATQDTFTKSGRLITRGQPIPADDVDYVEGKSPNLIPAPAGLEEVAIVEVSAIAPTGPNPRNPQQIAPDVVQTTDGYVQAGARLVGEVTLPQKQRIEIVGIDVEGEDTTQADVTQALADADAERARQESEARLSEEQRAAAQQQGKQPSNEQNEDDDLVAGTVATVTADLDQRSPEELERLRAAEEDREKPRSGVLNAIDAELARR